MTVQSRMGKIRFLERFRNQKLNIKFTFVIIVFTIVPIGVFAGILFYNMEQNVVDENLNYMEYTMERNEVSIATNINSINMSTQFFLSDEKLLAVLNRAKEGKALTTEEWLTFKNENVSSLERLVNNNPLLYGVRVYAAGDNVQEMMPILYQASRMEKQEWAGEEDYFGWHYNLTAKTSLPRTERVISGKEQKKTHRSRWMRLWRRMKAGREYRRPISARSAATLSLPI